MAGWLFLDIHLSISNFKPPRQRSVATPPLKGGELKTNNFIQKFQRLSRTQYDFQCSLRHPSALGNTKLHRYFFRR